MNEPEFPSMGMTEVVATTDDVDVAESLIQQDGDYALLAPATTRAERRFSVTARQYLDDEVAITRNSCDGGFASLGTSRRFSVATMVSGSWTWESLGDSGTASQGPVLITPGRPFLFSGIVDAEITNVYFTEQSLARTARRLYGRDDIEVAFDSPKPRSPAHAAYFAQLVRYTNSVITSGALRHELVRSATLRNLAAGMLECFPLVTDRRRSGLSTAERARVFKLGVEFMEAHASLPITIDDVAAATSTSVPDVDGAFLAHAMMPARQYLAKLRLAAAHESLIIADPARITVDEIAAQWGFLTREAFQRQYVRAYGRSPQVTLAN